MDIWFFYSIFGIKMIHLWLLAALADVFFGFSSVKYEGRISR